MKIKQLLVILFHSVLVLFFTSCSRLPYEGVWEGSLYYVKLVYTFEGETFKAETYTQTDLMVGGGEGELVVTGDQLFLNYKKKYVFDNEVNEGFWANDSKTVKARFSVDGNTMMFLPEKPTVEIELTRIR